MRLLGVRGYGECDHPFYELTCYISPVIENIHSFSSRILDALFTLSNIKLERRHRRMRLQFETSLFRLPLMQKHVHTNAIQLENEVPKRNLIYLTEVSA